jgi:hypothetical protein
MLDHKAWDAKVVATSVGSRWLPSNIVMVAVLLVVVLIQLGSGPAWIYTQYSIDPWVYHGYFLHLQAHAVAFQGTYYGTRLAWILPGYLAHHYFSPLVANFLLRLYIYCLALFSTVAFVRRSYGPRCALLTGLLLCSTTEFLYQAGWDYVYGVGIAYMLVCIEEGSAAVVWLRERRSFGWWKSGAVYRAVFAGAAFAAAIHTNFFLFSLLPVAAWVVFGRAKWKAIFLLVPAIVGAGILTAVLGLVNVALKGPFLFFMPNVVVSRDLMKANPWFFAASTWIRDAWWLVAPGAVSLVALGFIVRLAIVRRTRKSSDDFIRIVDSSSLVLALTMFIIFTARGLPVLQYDYYASYLTIFLLVTVAALIGRGLDSWKTPLFYSLVAASVLVAVLVGSSLPFSLYVFRHVLPHTSAPALMLTLGVALLMVELLNRRILLSLGAIGLSGFVLLQLAATAWQGDGTLRRREYLEVTQESRELGRLTRDQPLWFWYTWLNQPDNYYMAVAGTYLWGYRIVGTLVPDTTDFAFDQLLPGAFVAIMDNSPSVLDQAVAVLRADGVAIKPIQRLASSAGATSHMISLVEVTGRNPQPSSESRVGARSNLAPVREILNYDLPNLVQNLSNAVDGHKPQMVEPVPPGVFHNTQPHNHLDTPFLACDGRAEIAALEVSDTVDPQPDTFGPMKMLVQDQDYRTLSVINVASKANDDATVSLPTGTRAIRLTFLVNEKGYIRLPSRVRIVGLKYK